MYVHVYMYFCVYVCIYIYIRARVGVHMHSCRRILFTVQSLYYMRVYYSECEMQYVLFKRRVCQSDPSFEFTVALMRQSHVIRFATAQ